MDTPDDLDNNIENGGNNHTVNDNDNNAFSDHTYSYNSLCSAYDSRPSARSSISSSISGWTLHARSTSVCSQGSNDSVNLDALIAEGSDINEERPLELEDGDDVEWSKDQQRQLQQQQQQQLQEQQQQLQEQQQQNALANVNRSGLRSRSTTGGSQADMHQYEDQDVGECYSVSEGNSEVETPTMEEDEEFEETRRGFSQLSSHSMDIPEVRGLTMSGGRRSTVTSPRFSDGRNFFDLETDYADTPAGHRPGDRMSNISNYSSAGSDRSSISRLPAAGNSRPPASGLKAPSTRLAQPGTRSMLAQPKAARSSGLQAPKAGSQVPRSGLQAPKAGSSSALVARGSSIAVPGRTTANTKIPPADQRKGVTSSRLPSNTANSTVRTGTKSQIAPPNSSRKPSVTGANRQSLLQAPSASRIASTTTGRPPSRTTTNPISPKRTLTAPNLLTSPTRSASDRHLNSAYLVSPTSSQGSSSSLTARDTVTSVSRRLSSATGTSQLTQPKTAVRGRSISMYGSGGLHTNRDIVHHQQQDYEEADYAVLTPPQSPSSKAGSRAATGIPRSGIATPSRLINNTVSTRTGRAVSPPQSAGSNSSNQGSMLPRSHTPTSSLPVSRMTSGLVSPRAGRH
ncbi:hypothetical protein BGX20_009755 [Mortierella sp. AD010]|nr:hypothetical protein BGX20_009755 [Mortierella sp. AD010]